MKIARCISFPLLALSALLGLLGCSAPEPDNVLVVGMELSYPPFEMTDTANQPAGVSVDLAKALGEHLGRPVRIENITFPGLISSLKTGKIDLIISSMTVTEDRAKSIAFSDPYLTTGLCLLVSKNADIQSIDDLNTADSTIAVKQGTSGHLYAVEHLKQARILPLEKETSAVLEVAQGKADAFIYDALSTLRNWQRHPETTRALLDPFRQESWAIGMRIGEDELRSEINAFLKAYRESGGFDTLADRHLAAEKKQFEALGYPFFF